MAKTEKGTFFGPEDLERQTQELVKAFEKKGVELTQSVDVGMEGICIVVQGQAKENVNVDTGLLKNSISRRVTKSFTKVIGEVGSAVEYAPDQEFGPYGNHFLTNAVNMRKNEFLPIMTKAMQEGGL